MSDFFGISEAGSIALHAMVMLSRNPGRLVRIKEIADTFSFSEAHLAKVLGRLVRAGLVEGTRGPSGGYKLSAPPDDISLFEIYEVIEGKQKHNKCMFSIALCDGSVCSLGGYFLKVAGDVEKHLSNTKLSDISFNKAVFNIEIGS